MAVADDVATVVEHEHRSGQAVLVIGGDCTITIGVAGLQPNPVLPLPLAMHTVQVSR